MSIERPEPYVLVVAVKPEQVRFYGVRAYDWYDTRKRQIEETEYIVHIDLSVNKVTEVIPAIHESWKDESGVFLSYPVGTDKRNRGRVINVNVLRSRDDSARVDFTVVLTGKDLLDYYTSSR